MCGGFIDWCAFDWSSFATLTTGLMAVGAAAYAGLKQLEILSRQTQLEEVKLRADLFQKRMETYEAIKDFLLNFWPDPDKNPSDQDQMLRVSLKIRESQFLFSDPSIYETLKSYWEQVHDTQLVRKQIETDANLTLDERKAAQAKLLAHPQWAEEKARNLPDLFRHDLKIIK